MSDSDPLEQSQNPVDLDVYNRLAYQSQVVLRVGQLLLGAGASAYRVKSSMARVAGCIGIETHQSVVTMKEIVATSFGSGTFRTEVVENAGIGVNNDLIDRLNRYIHRLPHGSRAEDVDRVLSDIAAHKPPYSRSVTALASGLACAGFAFLNGGGLVPICAVFVAAMLGQLVRSLLLARGYNHFGVWMVCAAAAALVYMGSVVGFEAATGISSMHQGGVIAAILFLVPGVPMVTAIVEVVREDFSAAVPRLGYAFALIAAAAASLWTVTAAFSWSLEPEAAPLLAMHDLVFWRFVASYAGAVGFAMLFRSPWKSCLLAALIGATVNVGRLSLIGLGWSAPLMTAVAALMIGFLAAIAARYTRYTRVSLSVPGAVIMIPGAFLYRALAELNVGEVSNALEALTAAAFTIAAIGFGLAIARMLTDRDWRVAPKGPMPKVAAAPWLSRGK